MYVLRSEAEELQKRFIESVSKNALGANEFFSRLSQEDDWSFVIKSHALIEAAVTRLITTALKEERIKATIERLPLSDSQTGKIAIVKQMGLLEQGELRFIRWFSELRNELVHKVENIDFTFAGRWSDLDANQKKSWRDSINWSREPNEDQREFYSILEQNPKLAIRMAAFTLIAICETHSSQALMLVELNAASEATTKDQLERQQALIDLQHQVIEDQHKVLETLNIGASPSKSA